MTPEQFKQVLQSWQLNGAQAAKILCVHSNKLSEYLDGVSRIPCAVALHIEALQHVPDQQRLAMFEQRLNRKAHQDDTK
jgi:hypothetical protein